MTPRSHLALAVAVCCLVGAAAQLPCVVRLPQPPSLEQHVFFVAATPNSLGNAPTRNPALITMEFGFGFLYCQRVTGVREQDLCHSDTRPAIESCLQSGQTLRCISPCPLEGSSLGVFVSTKDFSVF